MTPTRVVATTESRRAGAWRLAALWPRYADAFMLGALAVMCAFHLFALLRLPAPFVDEAYRASRAWALLQSGRAFGVLEAGVFDRFEGYWTFFPYVETWFLAQSIRLIGLNLLAVRLVSFVFGLILLVVVYVAARELAGARPALLSALLVSLSPGFAYSSHLGRQDIMVSAFGFLAIALCVTEHADRLTVRSVLSGLAVAMAFEIHPNGMIYAVPIVLVLLVEHGWGILKAPRFWGFVLGTSLGLALYAALHILPYPQTYIALTKLGFGASHTPPAFTLKPGLWFQGLVDVLGLLSWSGSPALPLALAASALMLLKPMRGRARILAVFAGLIVGCAELIRAKHSYYGILISPAADILAAVLLAWLWQQRARARERHKPALALMHMLLVACSCGLVVLTVVPIVTLASHDPMPDYQSTVERIRQTVPAGRSIMGSQQYWLSMPDQPYWSWEQLVYYRRYAPGSTLADAFQEFRPDYLILDGHIEGFVIDDHASVSDYTRSLSLPKADLEAFLSRRAVLVASFRSTAYGLIRIYRIDWSDIGSG